MGLCVRCLLLPQDPLYPIPYEAQHQVEEAQLEDCIGALCCTACAVGQDTLELQRRAQQAFAPAVHVAVPAAVHVAMPTSTVPGCNKEEEQVHLTKADPADQV